MTLNDINRIFTEKVSELIAQGYQINPYTMSGSQGEIAHIDLMKDDEILRVYMEHVNDFGKSYNGYMVIRVGRNTDTIRNGWAFATIWNNHLEILSEIRLAKITDNYFTTPEEGAKAARKRLERWKRNNEDVKRELVGDAYKMIALRHVRKQRGMKNCKLAEIEKVERVNASRFDEVLPDLSRYDITARGKCFSIYPNAR